MRNKTVLTFLCAFAFLQFSYSQSIQDIIDQVSNANLQTNVEVLSGEQNAIINGTLQTITTRHRANNDLAARFIEEQFIALDNLSVEIQNFNSAGKNIIATQLGKTNPENIYIVCAHYDSVTEYCADDNATGVAAVLEIARIVSKQCTDNTIVYALWDEEEIGLLGANFYAQQAADNTNGNTRDNILGVLNMDMIGYDGDAPGTAGDNDFDIDVRNIGNSVTIKDDLLSILNTYTFDLNPIVVNPGTTASDHARFWNQGYSAVLVGESWETSDETPNYHSANDRVIDIDFQYMTELTKLVAAYMATKSGLVNLDNTVTQSDTTLTSNDLSASYQWYNCDTDSEINGETNRVFTPVVNGNYAVTVSNGSCTEKSRCYNFSTLTSEEFIDSELQVYPNPVSSVLKIDNTTSETLNITIYNILGKQVKTFQAEQNQNKISLNNIETGVYFVKVFSETKSSIFKIVKE